MDSYPPWLGGQSRRLPGGSCRSRHRNAGARSGRDAQDADDGGETVKIARRFWNGYCGNCDCEWEGMLQQNICPICGSSTVDIREVGYEGPGITVLPSISRRALQEREP